MNTWETLLGFVVLFVLGMGLFTIVSMVIKIIKGNKSGVPKNQNPPSPPMQKGRIFINGFAFEGTFTMQESELLYRSYSIVPLTLEQLLEKAVEQEDYEYAAKIRDRIKAKKADEIH